MNRFLCVYILLGEVFLLVTCEDRPNCTHEPNAFCPVLEGDIYIGGLVNIHRVTVVTDNSLTEGPIKEKCLDPYDHGMFTSLSILYAIDEINAGTFLDLKNISIGYMLSDGCRSRSVALRGASDISTGACGINETPIAIVADTFSGSIGPVANYFQLTNTPVIAVWATSVEFTDTNLYPTFFRTVPNDNHQADALIDIVESFNWTWVGALATDENYGRLGIAHFREEAEKRGICIAYEMYLPTVIDTKSVTEAVDLLMNNPNVKVIITFINSGYEVVKIFKECDRRNVSKKIWVGTDVWIISRIFADNTYYNVIDAAFGTSVEEVRNEDFWNYFLSHTPNNTNINFWFNEFWEKTFDCSLYSENNTVMNQECWSHSLEEKADEFRTYIDFTTYNAVYAIGYAIYDIIECRPPNGLLKDGLCPDVSQLEQWQLMQYLRNVNFTHHIKDRQFMFDDNYEVLARYTVYDWKRTPENTVKIEIIGEYDKSAQDGNYLRMNNSAILWDGGTSKKVPTSVCSLPCKPGTRKLHDTKQPICCFDCVPCSTNTISTNEDQSECDKCAEGYYSNDENTECLLKEMDVLDWSDPGAIGFLVWSGVGCILTFITIAIFYVKRESEIVKSSSRDLSMILHVGIVFGFLSPILFIMSPTDTLCQLRISISSVLDCLLLSVFLIKIYMVIKIFNRGKKGKTMTNLKIRLKRYRLLIVSMITGFQILIVVLAFFASPVKVVKDVTSSTKTTIVQCDTTLITFMWNDLFNLILIVVCFVFAFRARKMPHNYHEARFISVVMTFWIIIFLVSITTHLFTVGKLQPIIAIMFILILYTLILMMMFLPKCYLLIVAQSRQNSEPSPPKTVAVKGGHRNFATSSETLSRESGVQDCNSSHNDFNTHL
ncbi:extracellular calcium-sensing receptor-like [Antedon mediterranea]|uniref:extracellular calcium-sensing receptor-like n=1 Tax=Antedon mediterranea TaxID=105859 RepID=UPI003AF8C78E